jgi:hypothetical protein
MWNTLGVLSSMAVTVAETFILKFNLETSEEYIKNYDLIIINIYKELCRTVTKLWIIFELTELCVANTYGLTHADSGLMLIRHWANRRTHWHK